MDLCGKKGRNIFPIKDCTFAISDHCGCVCVYLSAVVSEELSSVVDDLLVSQVGVWLLLTHAQHLPQSHSERPHVTGRGELTLEHTHQHDWNAH